MLGRVVVELREGGQNIRGDMDPAPEGCAEHTGALCSWERKVEVNAAVTTDQTTQYE